MSKISTDFALVTSLQEMPEMSKMVYYDLTSSEYTSNAKFAKTPQ